MKKRLLQGSLPLGLLIFVGYQICSRLMQNNEVTAQNLFVVSIVLMLVGIAYNSWCFGRRKSPYEK